MTDGATMNRRTWEELWGKTLGDPRVCIAVLDGPVDLSHPCFAGADLTVLETLAGTPRSFSPLRPGLAAAHGTHVASVLFGQPGSSVQGIAPRCRGLIVPVFAGTEDGRVRPCSQLDLARGIVQAMAAGANIINISGGMLDASGAAETTLAAAIERCTENGVLVVAAAGNDGCPCLHLPAATPGVLVVGAMDARGEPLEFSNWGAAYRTRGVLAEADNMLGAIPGGEVTRAGGTSFAAPLVAGLAGLLMSGQLQRGEPLDTNSVRGAILETAINCDEQPTADCRRLLAGRLNPVGAWNQLAKGNPAIMTDITPSCAESTPVESSQPTPAPASVKPSSAGGCGCKSNAAPQLVYALGQLDYDFGTEANRDAFKQLGVDVPESRFAMVEYLTNIDAKLYDGVPQKPVRGDYGTDELFNEAELAYQSSFRNYLRMLSEPYTQRAYASQLTWILKQDELPIYAIQPSGPFAEQTYTRLLEFFDEQVAEISEQVSLPGYVVGKTKLLNGTEIPVVSPDIRGLCNWSIEKLLERGFPG